MISPGPCRWCRLSGVFTGIRLLSAALHSTQRSAAIFKADAQILLALIGEACQLSLVRSFCLFAVLIQFFMLCVGVTVTHGVHDDDEQLRAAIDASIEELSKRPRQKWPPSWCCSVSVLCMRSLICFDSLILIRAHAYSNALVIYIMFPLRFLQAPT